MTNFYSRTGHALTNLLLDYTNICPSNTFVSGTVTVTVGEETKLICPNELTYIKISEVHRLANEGKMPVILIETQVGEYTGEDDIVRLDDDFKRN